MKKPSVIGVILLVIGIGSIFNASYTFINNRILNGWVSTEGEGTNKQVVYVEAFGGTPKPCVSESGMCADKIFHAYPMVYYQYTAGDKQHVNDVIKVPQIVYFAETQNSQEADDLINKYEVGEKITVFYRKKAPTTAILILPENDNFLPDILMILFGFILIGFVVRHLQNKDPLHKSIFVRS